MIKFNGKKYSRMSKNDLDNTVNKDKEYLAYMENILNNIDELITFEEYDIYRKYGEPEIIFHLEGNPTKRYILYDKYVFDFSELKAKEYKNYELTVQYEKTKKIKTYRESASDEYMAIQLAMRYENNQYGKVIDVLGVKERKRGNIREGVEL